jgi:hypothetical protein
VTEGYVGNGINIGLVRRIALLEPTIEQGAAFARQRDRKIQLDVGVAVIYSRPWPGTAWDLYLR